MGQTMKDLGASLIRTAVATVIGTILAYFASRWGWVLDGSVADGVVQSVTAAFVIGYYAIVRALEFRYPMFGWLLGLASPPKYRVNRSGGYATGGDVSPRESGHHPR